MHEKSINVHENCAKISCENHMKNMPQELSQNIIWHCMNIARYSHDIAWIFARNWPSQDIAKIHEHVWNFFEIAWRPFFVKFLWYSHEGIVNYLQLLRKWASEATAGQWDCPIRRMLPGIISHFCIWLPYSSFSFWGVKLIKTHLLLSYLILFACFNTLWYWCI